MKKQPCNQNWRKDDGAVMADKMKSVGCKPPHWKLNASLPVCKVKEQMAKFLEWEISPHTSVCRSIQKILHTYCLCNLHLSSRLHFLGNMSFSNFSMYCYLSNK